MKYWSLIYASFEVQDYHIFENINIYDYDPLIIKFNNVQVKLNDQFEIGSSDIQDILFFKPG